MSCSRTQAGRVQSRPTLARLDPASSPSGAARPQRLTAVLALPFSHFWTLRVMTALRSEATRCSSLRAWRVARAATETYLLKLSNADQASFGGSGDGEEMGEVSDERGGEGGSERRNTACGGARWCARNSDCAIEQHEGIQQRSKAA